MSNNFIEKESGNIIHDTIQCVLCLVKEGKDLNDENLLEVEKAIKYFYGGQTIYCSQGIDPATLGRLVLADHKRGVSKRAMAQAYGLTVKTIGKILKNSSAG